MVSVRARRQVLAALRGEQSRSVTHRLIAARVGYTRRHIITVMRVLEAEKCIAVVHHRGAPSEYRVL
jgi:GTP-sensing pleiotropic transcriptional regulator CodY